MILSDPQVAFRDCGHCQKYVYDEETGKPELSPPKTGKPIRRAGKNKAPCLSSKGCPKGTPENPKSLTKQNSAVYRHYRECRAVNHFPDDDWVRHHAALITEIEEHAGRMRELRLAQIGAIRGG